MFIPISMLIYIIIFCFGAFFGWILSIEYIKRWDKFLSFITITILLVITTIIMCWILGYSPIILIF